MTCTYTIIYILKIFIKTFSDNFISIEIFNRYLLPILITYVLAYLLIFLVVN